VNSRSYTILDVFTDKPLEGNALAVFEDAAGLSTEVMQRTARELNLSETVFVFPPGGDGEDARVRIFTPATELPFAGHPMLGTAFALGERSGVQLVRLLTGAGLVPVTLERDGGAVVYGEMEQPIPTTEPFAAEDQVLAALGVERSELPVEAYRNGPVHVYVALDSERSVQALRPDLAALREVSAELGCSCFARVSGDGRFKTRMFAPALGVPEDPATGSAAGPLAVHLARHGWIDYGREIEISQGTEIGRPSLLRARVEGSDAKLDRVVVGGSAVIVARGEYRLP
jgi:trans-2,3-dihydro-3-hydroxyanthranilate isomerase